jgi:hypothetical protein
MGNGGARQVQVVAAAVKLPSSTIRVYSRMASKSIHA